MSEIQNFRNSKIFNLLQKKEEAKVRLRIVGLSNHGHQIPDTVVVSMMSIKRDTVQSYKRQSEDEA